MLTTYTHSTRISEVDSGALYHIISRLYYTFSHWAGRAHAIASSYAIGRTRVPLELPSSYKRSLWSWSILKNKVLLHLVHDPNHVRVNSRHGQDSRVAFAYTGICNLSKVTRANKATWPSRVCKSSACEFATLSIFAYEHARVSPNHAHANS